MMEMRADVKKSLEEAFYDMPLPFKAVGPY
jgi:hypothetical protein